MPLMPVKLLAIFLSGALPVSAQVSELCGKGDALDARNNNREALSFYLEADRQDPDNADILWRIAKQYSQLMSEALRAEAKKELGGKALAAVERAKALAPKDAQVRLTAAIVYGRIALMESNRRKAELARLIKEEAEAAVRLDPREDYAWHVLGRWNYELANTNPFLKSMGEAIYGKFPAASNEKAAECFQKAVSLDPQQVLHHVELGRAYLALGERDKARVELQKALALPSTGKDDDAGKQRALLALKQL